MGRQTPKFALDKYDDIVVGIYHRFEGVVRRVTFRGLDTTRDTETRFSVIECGYNRWDQPHIIPEAIESVLIENVFERERYLLVGENGGDYRWIGMRDPRKKGCITCGVDGCETKDEPVNVKGGFFPFPGENIDVVARRLGTDKELGIPVLGVVGSGFLTGIELVEQPVRYG